MMVMLLYWKHTFNVSVSWFPKRAVFGLTAFCVLTLALVTLLGLKLLDLVCSPRRTILKRANIRHSYFDVDEAEDLTQSAGSWKYAGGALFGRRPWQEKLPCVCHHSTGISESTHEQFAEERRVGYGGCEGWQHSQSSSSLCSMALTKSS